MPFFSEVELATSSNTLLEFAQILYPDAAESPFGGLYNAALFGRLKSSDANYKIDNFDALVRNDKDVTLVGVKACVEGTLCGKLVAPLNSPATFWKEWTYPGIDTGVSEAEMPTELQEAVEIIKEHFQEN